MTNLELHFRSRIDCASPWSMSRNKCILEIEIWQDLFLSKYSIFWTVIHVLRPVTHYTQTWWHMVILLQQSVLVTLAKPSLSPPECVFTNHNKRWPFYLFMKNVSLCITDLHYSFCCNIHSCCGWNILTLIMYVFFFMWFNKYYFIVIYLWITIQRHTQECFT